MKKSQFCSCFNPDLDVLRKKTWSQGQKSGFRFLHNSISSGVHYVHFSCLAGYSVGRTLLSLALEVYNKYLPPAIEYGSWFFSPVALLPLCPFGAQLSDKCSSFRGSGPQAQLKQFFRFFSSPHLCLAAQIFPGHRCRVAENPPHPHKLEA